MKDIVISAINFTEGGPLTVLKDVLKSVKKNFLKKYHSFNIR